MTEHELRIRMPARELAWWVHEDGLRVREAERAAENAGPKVRRVRARRGGSR